MIEIEVRAGASAGRRFEVDRDAAEEYKGFVRERMMHAASLAVPLDVDVGAAENWRDAKS